MADARRVDLPHRDARRGRDLAALVPGLLRLVVVEDPLRFSGVFLSLLERLPERLVEDLALVLLALDRGREQVLGAVLAPLVLARRFLERAELVLRGRGLVRQHGAGVRIDLQR